MCCRAVTPAGTNDCCDRKAATVRARHETVDRRFKMFGAICQTLIHPLEKHTMVLKSTVSIAQLTSSNVDSSFEVEHSE